MVNWGEDEFSVVNREKTKYHDRVSHQGIQAPRFLSGQPLSLPYDALFAMADGP
jgi:hypothetical protein